MKTVYMLFALGSLVGFSVGAGCWVVAESHCGNLGGDQTCVDRGSGAYCDTCRPQNDGCTDVKPVDGCQHLGSGQETTTGVVEETTGTTLPADTGNVTLPLDTTHTTSEGVSAEGVTVGGTGAECTGDGDCGDATPFCAPGGVCVACGEMASPDAACAGKSSGLPICVNDVCVSCADGLMLDSSKPGVCLPCTEHDECESGACDIFEGTCFDPDRVVGVSSSGGQPDTIAEKILELQEMEVDRRGELRGVLVLQDESGLDFDESIIINGASLRAVAFIAEQPGQDPDWGHTENAMPSPTLTVTGATTRVYLDRIVLRNDTNTIDGQSLFCDGAQVDIRRSHLIENLGGGIVARGQCKLVVQNSFIGVNPNDEATHIRGVDALRIADASVTATILYSTIGAGLNASALLCPNGGPNVNVRNSFLVSAAASTEEVDCAGVTLTRSATEEVADPWVLWDPLDPSDMDPSWFVDYYAGDFRLTANAPETIMVAEWLEGDPMVDIEDDLRDMEEFDYAGADRP